MVLKVAELIFNDTPSKYNKDLTDYLDRNIEIVLMRGQIKFRFKIAKATELSQLRSKGIKRLPAMMLDNKPYVGVPVIIEELVKRVKKSKGVAMPKNDAEVLDDYYRKTLGNFKQDGDGKIDISNLDQEEDPTMDLGNELQREMSRRKTDDPYTRDDKKQRGRREPPPSKPSRNALQDDDMEDRRPQNSNTSRHRDDNLDAKDPGNPMTALQHVQGGGMDDDLMATLLQKMSAGDE